MRSTLAGLCWIAALALPCSGFAVEDPKSLPPEPAAEAKKAGDLERIDGQLHRGEWAAAETAARQLVEDALQRKSSGTFSAVARLALAESGQGKTEDALWHWGIAQNLKIDFDPKPFGAPGELLASHPLRHADEAPAGLTVRQSGDGGPPFSPPSLTEAKKVELPAVWARRPKGMRLQVLVDAQGRAVQPVIVHSTSQALSYVVLEGLKDWRFEPAQAAGSPVAAFYEVKFPPHRPLVEVANFKGSPLAPTEELLRTGRYGEAGKQIGKLWKKTAEGQSTIPSRGFLGVALALKALAAAGQGQEEGAICRWQAAQTLEPGLYGTDLSAYGAAGKLLEDHPWGGEPTAKPKKAPRSDPNAEVRRPELLKHPNPPYPEYARVDWVQGTVVVESIITSAGAIRSLLLVTPDAPPGLEASTLDTLCDWTFKPAIYQGEPVTVYYTLTVNFEIKK